MILTGPPRPVKQFGCTGTLHHTTPALRTRCASCRIARPTDRRPSPLPAAPLSHLLQRWRPVRGHPLLPSSNAPCSPRSDSVDRPQRALWCHTTLMHGLEGCNIPHGPPSQDLNRADLLSCQLRCAYVIPQAVRWIERPRSRLPRNHSRARDEPRMAGGGTGTVGLLRALGRD